MSNLAIQADNLSKKYQIGLATRHDTLRDHIAHGVRTLLRRNGRLSAAGAERSAPSNTIWALKDTSFEIHQGDVVGIVGRNGAGKSTLLKILSRITEPTSGSAKIFGRVGSLLEVGTGFHPELTGRENVYLNGGILGMRKAEIAHKFDEIVAFAEVEKFIDTPVKHYSSGMHVRLAFAVAAHLEPEILLIDEVLAVGDVVFQKKCLGKMGEVATEGRTILFVSHNMAAIADLCQTAMWIDGGRLRAFDAANKVVAEYLRTYATGQPSWQRPKSAPVNPKATLLSARVLSKDGLPASIIEFAETFSIEINYSVLRPIMGCTVAYRLRNGEGTTIMVSSERDSTELESQVREIGTYHAACRIPGGLLRQGPYFLTVGVYIEGSEMIERFENILSFEISAVDCPAADGRAGVIAPVLEWNVNFDGNPETALLPQQI